ncbi:hypothetical protein LINPERHAP2_LOCUS14791 [Linum perenne]
MQCWPRLEEMQTIYFSYMGMVEQAKHIYIIALWLKFVVKARLP